MHQKSRKKTVLFIVDSFTTGGVLTFVQQYVEAIHEDYRVVVFGFSDSNLIPITNCQIVQIPRKISYSPLGLIKSFLFFIFHLEKLYRKEKVDAIHFSLTWSCVFSMFLPNTWKKYRITTFYGSYYHEATLDVDKNGKTIKHFGFKNAVKRQFLLNLQLLTFLFCSKIIVFSTYSKQFIIKNYSMNLEKKIRTIPGLITQTKQVSEKNNSDELVIINFGRMEIRKGIDNLLRAAKILIHKKINFKIIIASPLVESELVRHYRLYETLNLSLNVQFIHGIDMDQKSQLLSKADIFVMPSRDLETFGMTMLESLSYGVPVIGTPIGAIPEVLSKIDVNLVASDSSPESIAKKMIWYKNLTLDKKNNLRRRCRKIVKKYYLNSLYKEKIKMLYSHSEKN